MKYIKLFENFELNEAGTWILGDGVSKGMKNGPADDMDQALTYGTNNGVIAWYDKDGQYHSYMLKNGEKYKDVMTKYGIDYKWKDTNLVVRGSNGDFGDEGMANHPMHYNNR